MLEGGFVLNDGDLVLNDGDLVLDGVLVEDDGALVETVVEGALLEVGDFVDEGRLVLIFCIGIYSLRSWRRRSFRLVVTRAIKLDDIGKLLLQEFI